MDELKSWFFSDRKSNRLAVVGLGGVGKTQVAPEFAYLVQEIRPDYSIFWLSAVNAVTLEQSYKELAEQLSIPKEDENEDVRRSVQRFMKSEESGRWLLLLDNADEEGLVPIPERRITSINAYLPHRGTMLFTMRHKNAATSLAGSNVLTIPILPRDDAYRLFKSRLVEERRHRDDAALCQLLEELEFLPLAIGQVTAYLNVHPQVTIPEYLRMLKDKEDDRDELLRQEFDDFTREVRSPNAIIAALLISIEQIEKHSPHAAQILGLVSVLEYKMIPESLLDIHNAED